MAAVTAMVPRTALPAREACIRLVQARPALPRARIAWRGRIPSQPTRMGPYDVNRVGTAWLHPRGPAFARRVGLDTMPLLDSVPV